MTRRREEPADPRDDVHALGVIWYQLMTGDLEMMQVPADWTDEVRARGLSKDLTGLLGSCLAAKAEKRPASAGILAGELRALTTPAKIPTQPASAPTVPRPKQEERNRRPQAEERSSQTMHQRRLGKTANALPVSAVKRPSIRRSRRLLLAGLAMLVVTAVVVVGSLWASRPGPVAGPGPPTQHPVEDQVGGAAAVHSVTGRGSQSHPPRPQNPVTDPVDVVKKLGGRVELDDKNPAHPVISVDLNFRVGVTDATLKQLATLRELQKLELSSTKVTDAGLKELAELKELQTLNLGATQVTDAGLKELADLEGVADAEPLWLPGGDGCGPQGAGRPQGPTDAKPRRLL